MRRIIHNGEELAETIRQRREELGVMWKDLETKCGVCWNTVQNWGQKKGTRLGTAITALEALGMALVVVTREELLAQLVPREGLLRGAGHGWEERWFIGDDEEPDGKTLEEIVWINGNMMTSEGSNASMESDFWRERYGKQYGVRVWRGAVPPTEQQREETPWT